MSPLKRVLVICRSGRSFSLASPTLSNAHVEDKDIKLVAHHEKSRASQPSAKPGQYWHEEKIAGEVRRWNYRSEFVGRLGLNSDHSRIWLSFGLIIVVGLSLFVVVKSQVIEGRREQMKERDRIRKQMTAPVGISME